MGKKSPHFLSLRFSCTWKSRHIGSIQRYGRKWVLNGCEGAARANCSKRRGDPGDEGNPKLGSAFTDGVPSHRVWAQWQSQMSTGSVGSSRDSRAVNQVQSLTRSPVRSKQKKGQRQGWRQDYNMGPKSVQDTGPNTVLEKATT